MHVEVHATRATRPFVALAARGLHAGSGRCVIGVDAIQHTVDEGRRVLRAELLGELDRFVAWHMQESRQVDLKPDGDGLQLLVLGD